ncbi:MAG: hypothetical protein NTY10_06775, partial [Candidatus Omnitrophica bacterium]|nr:hypothetical protein [Candidatus Omnitrophota bacterium]
KSLEKVFRQYSYDKNKPLEHEIAWKELWRKKLQNGEKIPNAEIGELQVLKIGKVAIVGLPGEVMVEIGLKLKKAVKDIIIAGYANGILDYIPTSSALKEGGYEATSFFYHGYPGPYSFDLEEKLIKKVTALVRTR